MTKLEHSKIIRVAEYLEKSICFDGVLNPESEDFNLIEGAKEILLLADMEICPECSAVLEKQLHGVECSCGYWECW